MNDSERQAAIAFVLERVESACRIDVAELRYQIGRRAGVDLDEAQAAELLAALEEEGLLEVRLVASLTEAGQQRLEDPEEDEGPPECAYCGNGGAVPGMRCPECGQLHEGAQAHREVPAAPAVPPIGAQRSGRSRRIPE